MMRGAAFALPTTIEVAMDWRSETFHPRTKVFLFLAVLVGLTAFLAVGE